MHEEGYGRREKVSGEPEMIYNSGQPATHTTASMKLHPYDPPP